MAKTQAVTRRLQELQKLMERRISRRMEQEILKPAAEPQAVGGQVSRLDCIVSAVGATILAFTSLGASAAATIWAISRLMGLPDSLMWVAMALGAVPVLWATVWTAGRAWHVERRIEQGLDVDMPVFSLLHYWKKA